MQHDNGQGNTSKVCMSNDLRKFNTPGPRNMWGIDRILTQDDDGDEDDDDYDSEDLNDIYSKQTGALPAPKQPAIKQESNGRGAKRKLTPEPSPGPVAQKVRPCIVRF